MDFASNNLYEVKDVKELQTILGNNLYKYRDTSYICNKFYSLELHNGKRIFEKPSVELKNLQSKVYKMLSATDFPDYFFLCKNRSCIDGVAIHANNPSVIIKIDIKKFFPSTHRDKVYKFWRNDMRMGGMVAELMTNITTISLPNQNPLATFLLENKINSFNHLPTGAPTSPILAFLCNWRMYDEISHVVSEHRGTLSVYVDDITISGVKNPKEVLFNIRDILFHNGYRISSKKLA